MTQTRTRIVSALAILLGVVMIGGGGVKLAAVPSQVTAFTTWGLPAWFRALVGTFEILGRALLIVSATRPAGRPIPSTLRVGALRAPAAHRPLPPLGPGAPLP